MRDGLDGQKKRRKGCEWQWQTLDREADAALGVGGCLSAGTGDGQEGLRK